MNYTPLSGPLSKLAMTGVVTRPSVIAGKSYDRVSLAYSTAIHAALTRQVSAREALGRLEQDLVRITGLPPCRRQWPDAAPYRRTPGQPMVTMWPLSPFPPR